MRLKITKALATAEDAEDRDQQQGPGGNADATPHSSVRDGSQEADQIEIGCGSLRFEHRNGAIPQRTPQGDALK
jgi:hypothetical protein